MGMEVNLPKYSQRRVAMIKYLGELYNYRMVESSDIFKVRAFLFSSEKKKNRLVTVTTVP